MTLMQKHQIRRVPVVDKEGRIEGIVSTADLVLNADASAEDVDETITEISEPSGHRTGE
jgi:CBS-domain-containing membrane protein